MTFDEQQQAVAIARFAIIAPLVTRLLSPPDFTAARRCVLSEPHPYPGSAEWKCVSERTLGRWLRAYHDALPHGTVAALAALAPQGRSDRGKPRVFSAAILEEAVRLRQELATRSTANLVGHLEVPVKVATLAYHLRMRGFTRKAIAASSRAFPRYEAPAPNVTWQSDVKDGFWLPDPTEPSRKREVHLMGFLDDYSRLVTHGEFYFKESLPCLFDCFKKAVVKYGVPAKLYVDNGPIYRARQTRLVAARLGAKVVFATPYAPEGHGKVERFWLTVAGGFMEEARRAEIQTLAELNQHFWAWLDGYNRRVHGSTGKTPLERWGTIGAGVRRPHPADLAEAFLWEEQRRVKKTGTFSLSGNEYRVCDALVGKTVEVRFDPLDLATVRVFREGTFQEVAAPAALTAHTHRKATPKPGDAKYLPLPSSKRLLAGRTARRAADVDADFAPLAPVSGDRLTDLGWRQLLEVALGRPLAEAEPQLAERFFQRHAPLAEKGVEQVMQATVDRRGADRHLAFYLGEIQTFLTGRRS